MSPLSLGSEQVPRPGAGVHSGRFDDNTTILDQLLDVSARIGVADFSLFGGIEPDFSFADACDASGEALL